MSAPAITVIIPCYNSEQTVSATLRSVREQTMGDWEAVVVDDGSTDGSVAIAEAARSGECRIRLVRQENLGLAGSRNTGLAHASGEFVVFLDADDTLDPAMLERMLAAARAPGAADVVHCGFSYVGPRLEDFQWIVGAVECVNYFQTLAHWNPFACHCLMVRRSIISRTGEFDPSLRHCHDWDLWARLARAGARFHRVSETLAQYRLQPVSLSRNPSTFFEAGREILQRTHRADARVPSPAPEHATGCSCDMVQALRRWAVICSGLAVARGRFEEAHRILSPGSSEPCPEAPLGLDEMEALVHAVAFGLAVPRQSHSRFWAESGRNLMQFLVEHEDRTGRPGLAIALLSGACSRPVAPGKAHGSSALERPVTSIHRRAYAWLRRRVPRWTIPWST